MDNNIVEQNQLLKEQNELLRQQNELLRQNSNSGGLPSNDAQVFVKDLYTDEIRNGFLVTSHRKKLWNVQIGLINEFARVCRKYNLRWFAYGGTLLGAIRHNGFIPWDDDVDLAMLRPDYEKFKQVAAYELHDPYYLDLWQNYRWESKGNIDAPDEQELPLITIEQERKFPHSWPRLPFLKIRDNRTSLIEFTDRPTVNQSIWIDIFCLDPVPPFNNQQQLMNFELGRELLMAAAFPNEMKQAIANGANFVINRDNLGSLFKLTFRQRAIKCEEFWASNFFESPKIERPYMYILNNNPKFLDSSEFSETLYHKFEEIEIAIPVGYEQQLQTYYGDWHKPMYTHSHAQNYSADISYKQYFDQVKFSL